MKHVEKETLKYDSTSRPSRYFRAVQVEIAKYDRLTSAFPNCGLNQDSCQESALDAMLL